MRVLYSERLEKTKGNLVCLQCIQTDIFNCGEKVQKRGQ